MMCIKRHKPVDRLTLCVNVKRLYIAVVIVSTGNNSTYCNIVKVYAVYRIVKLTFINAISLFFYNATNTVR